MYMYKHQTHTHTRRGTHLARVTLVPVMEAEAGGRVPAYKGLDPVMVRQGDGAGRGARKCELGSID